MDFLKAEIARKKRLLEEQKLIAAGQSKSGDCDTSQQPAKKYFKRSDLLKKQELEYRAKHEPNQDDLKRAHELQTVKDTVLAGRISETSKSETPLLPRSEVIRKLRERGEPIILFAETEEEACKRLTEIEFNEPEMMNGRRNDFKDAMDKVDEAYLQEILKSQGTDEGESKSKYDVQPLPSEWTYEEVLGKLDDTNQGEIDVDCKVIMNFVGAIMKEWAEELNARDENIKMSVRGKIDSGVFTQTKTYLKPLWRILKKSTVTDDIRDSLLKIIRFALERNYILCNEAYMEMAIGNAPWPIGVTQTGIHARPAREGIFAKNVAHVLNDETQRKYIQGLKRLLTKAQEYYPTDPSRCVEYTRRPKTEEEKS